MANTSCDVHVHKWGDVKQSEFFVFICHGAAEHGARYSELASVFVSLNGYVVAPDHQGHGKTAELHNLPLGRARSNDAIDGMASDMVNLILNTNTNSKPWFLIGHSMGTVIAQYVLEKLKSETELMRLFRGLVLSGPPVPPSAVEMVAFKGLLKVMIAMNKGQAIIHALTFDKYDKQIRTMTGDKTLPKNSWLNEHAAAVTEYNEDPYCGHDLDFKVWQSLLYHIENLKNLKFSIRAPVLIVGGDCDPATDFGRNLDAVRDRLKTQVGAAFLEQLLFVGSRHELTKGRNKEILFSKLKVWTSACLGKPVANL